jgi:hypothetical protein
MKDLARRFPENPLLLPKDLKPSGDGLQIISLLNPGVFRYQTRPGCWSGWRKVFRKKKE